MSKPEYGEVLWGNSTEELAKGLLNISDPYLAEVAKSFYRDGYVKLENVIDPLLISQCKSEYDEWCNHNIQQYRGIRQDDRIPRIVNLHAESKAFQALFHESKELLRVLDLLFGYRSSVYTSLVFQHGTEQPLHRDTPVFRTAPEEFYFGVWFALENANEENGCLNVLQGGHKLANIDQYEFADEFINSGGEIRPGAEGIWAPFQQKLVAQCIEEGATLTSIPANAGDVVIWHPQLPHGGSKIRNPKQTRFSAVFHVVPERTPVYQADVFFSRERKLESCDSKRVYKEIGDRLFMQTGSPNFGSN